MHVFIVTQWNGMDYDDSFISNVGVFESLNHAVKYCKNTPAYRDYPRNSLMDSAHAYTIERWIDTQLVEQYNGDGEKI